MRQISKEDQILREIEELREDLSEWGPFGGSTEEKEAKKKQKRGQEFLSNIAFDFGSRENPYFNTISIRASKAAGIDKDEFTQQNILQMLQKIGKKPEDISQYKIEGDKGFIDFLDKTELSLGWASIPTEKNIVGNLVAPWEAQGQKGQVAIIYDVDTADDKSKREQSEKASKNRIIEKIKGFGFQKLEKIEVKDSITNTIANVKKAIQHGGSQSAKVVWNVDVFRVSGDVREKMKKACDSIDDVFEYVAALYNKVYGTNFNAGGKLWNSLYDPSKESKMKSLSQEDYEKIMTQAMLSMGSSEGKLSDDIVVNAKGIVGGAIMNMFVWEPQQIPAWTQNISNLGNPIVTFSHLFYYLIATKKSELGSTYVAISDNARILVGKDGGVQESHKWGDASMLRESVDAMRRGVDLNVSFKERVMLISSKKLTKVKKEEHILSDIETLKEEMRKNSRSVMREGYRNREEQIDDLKPIHGEEKYVEYDEEYECWGVFGSESGFCYGSCASKGQAEDKLEQLEESVQIKKMTLKECIISYIPESLREDYDPDEDEGLYHEFGRSPDYYAGMNYAPERQTEDEDDERHREQSEENYAELMSASDEYDDENDDEFDDFDERDFSERDFEKFFPRTDDYDDNQFTRRYGSAGDV
jgi:hypothetical protein